MKYSELATIFERLARTRSEPKRRAILVDLLRTLDAATLRTVAHFILGELTDASLTDRLGIGPGTVRDVIAERSGIEPDEVEEAIRQSGELDELAAGSVAGEDTLTVADLRRRIDRTIRRNERRTTLISFVLDHTSPLGARYFVRMVLGRMRVGVGFGALAGALAEAFGADRATLEQIYAMTNDVGLTALQAMKGGKGVRDQGPALFHPYQFMNAQRMETAEEIFERLGGKVGLFEVKYDGARLQIHIERKGGELTIRLYSRRLNDVTESLPEVVAALKHAWRGGSAIVEGEAVAFDRTLSIKQPFQIVLTRLGRKSGIAVKAEEYPLVLFLFDLLYLAGTGLMTLPQRERRLRLADQIAITERVRLTESIESDSREQVAMFFRRAIEEGEEGLMAKDPDALYLPGRRAENWMKLKPEFETLDVVIVGGIWGSGRRRGTLSSLLIAIREEKVGELKTVGKVGSGFSEEMLRTLTATLEPLIVSQKGSIVQVEPSIVIEVDFQDIQKTSAYQAGYALRIPRFKQLRSDKSIDDADTLERLLRLYQAQHGDHAGASASSDNRGRNAKKGAIAAGRKTPPRG